MKIFTLLIAQYITALSLLLLLLFIIIIIIIIIIISFITVFPGVLFVHQPGENHASRASVTQVNHSVNSLSTFLRIRADPSMQIFWIFVILPWCFLPYYYYYNNFFIIIINFLFTYLSKNGKLKSSFPCVNDWFLISTSISACDLDNLFFTHKVVNNNRVVVESETLFSANLSYSDPILSPLKTSLEYSENDYLFIYLFI